MKADNNELKYWLAFSKIESVGSTTILRLYNHFGSMEEAWNAGSSEIIDIPGIRSKTASAINESKNNIEPEKLIDEVESRNIFVLTYVDENYPQLLKQIHDPPALLFVKGSLDVCNLENTLAIVGSRKCSHYAGEMVNKIIEEATGTDLTIVSGLAMGVDTHAHKAALNSKLKTIAVLGGGHDYLHPSSNTKLAREIIDGNGAVISECYPTIIPEPFRFPVRNRIVSGLSKGTLIVEAALKSGALITAKLCVDQNRELMCIPGMVTNSNAEGVNNLLKEGAALVTSFDDILNQLNWCYKAKNLKKENCEKIELLDNESKIYDIVNLEPVPIDKIISNLNLSIGEIMVALTSLELKGLIKQLTGEKYTRV